MRPFVFAILALISAPLSAAEVRPPALDRVVKIEVWGGGLNDVVQAVWQQAGVEMLLYPSDFAAPYAMGPLYMSGGRATLRAVLEGLARRHGFRYRVSNAGKIEISRGYDWAASEPALRFIRLDAITPANGANLEEMRVFLGELIKPLPLVAGDYSLTLEKSPTRENPASIRAVAALPPVLADYLERAVKCLSGDPGDARGGVRFENRNFAVAWDKPPDWGNLLDRQVRIPAASDVRKAIADVCDQAGVVMILHGAPNPGPAQPLPGNGTTGLGRMAEELAARFNLGKRVFLPSGAILFEPGQAAEMETDPRSRELFWGGLAVAGFDARLAAERAGGAANLIAALKRDVFPWLWRDPVCAIVFSPVSGRLAVIAPANAVEAVAGKLKEIERQ